MRWVVLALDAHVGCEPPDVPVSDHERVLLEVGGSRHHSEIPGDPPKLLDVLQPGVVVLLFLAGAVALLAVKAYYSSDNLDEIRPLERQVVLFERVDTDALRSAY